MKPNTVAGPRPIYTALPHFPSLLDFSSSLRPIAKGVNESETLVVENCLRRQTSAVLPIGLALFDQGAEAFLGIFQAIKLVQENVHGIFQAVA